MNDFQCVILCGGRGTRLGALTATTPKPLLQVGQEPFLETLVFELGRQGCKNILLLAAFQSEMIEAFAVQSPAAKRFGIAIEVSTEPDQAGTGGALWHARDRLEETFFLLNGDTWFDIPVLSLSSAFHRADKDLFAVIALRTLPDVSRYGAVSLKQGIIVDFSEKIQSNGPGYVNGGVYYLSKKILEFVPSQGSLEIVFAQLAATGRLAGLPNDDAYFLDIGIPETYELAQRQVPARRRRAAVFLDRDGVLNEEIKYVGTIDRFYLVDGAAQAVARLNALGYYVFVVTNQAGIARGYYTEDDYAILMRHLASELAAHGAHFDDARHCPFHPEATVPAFKRSHHWRKPEPGMLVDLMERWPLDNAGSFLIGDQQTDIAAAKAAGIDGYLFQGGNLDTFLTGVLGLRGR